MKRDLNLSSLATIDEGRLAAAFDMELAKVVEDMNERPGDKTPRIIKLTLRMAPVAPGGTIEDVRVEFDIAATVPKKRTKTYSMEVHGTQRVVFSEFSPDNPRQGTLDEAKVETRITKKGQ